MKNEDIRPKDIGRKDIDQLFTLDPSKFPKLPYPYDTWEEPPMEELSETKKEKYNTSLDGAVNLAFPKIETKQEEDEMVAKFLAGLHKLFSKENNWTFLKPLMLTMDNCVKCNTCAEACPVWI